MDYTVNSSAKNAPHRKLIDIPADIFGTLSIKAAAMGMNLKKYIEQLLVMDANEMDDEELYRLMCRTQPDGHEMLSPSEQEDFERRHGLC